MADVAFGHRVEPHALPTTMNHRSQWHHVPPPRLMAHMGTYSPDEMNGLHWRWHRRAALRIRTAMQWHNIWAIPGSPAYQGHASGHRRPGSQEFPEPPRQTARHDSPGCQQGPPAVGSPPGTYRSPLRPFTPRRDRGSPHTQGMQGGKRERHQETRNPGRSGRRSRTPTPRSTASRLPRGYGQRPWRPGWPAGPTDIICCRSPAPVHEPLHRVDGYPHHSHASRASATGSAPHRPPPGNRPCVQLVRCLPPRVGGRSATGGTKRRGHAAKGTRSRPATRTGGGGRSPESRPPKAGHGGTNPDTGTRHPTNRAHAPQGSQAWLKRSQATVALRTHHNNGGTTRATREQTKK